MSSKIRIGEVLLKHEYVDAEVLLQALRHPPARSQMRLVSQLILRAQLDPDAGTLALAEQTGYPAALERHLEGRDPGVKDLIPIELVQTWCVVPLGRNSNGELVTVASDPTMYLQAALEHATKMSIQLAVAPSIHVEKLIRSVYGVEPQVPEGEARPIPEASNDIGDVKVSLDVDRQLRRARATSKQFAVEVAPELPPRRRSGITQNPVEATLEQIDQAITLFAVERLVIAYAARRWQAAILLRIEGANAIGHLATGDQLDDPSRLVFPLTMPSILLRAIELRSATADGPPTGLQVHLQQLLGDALNPVAAPIFIGNRLHGVFVVGDPRHDDPAKSIADAGRLVDGLSAAHERFTR